MLTLRVLPHGDGAFADLSGKRIHHVSNSGGVITVAGLAGGLASGKPSVVIRIDLDNGESVLAETSLSLFLTAAEHLRAIHGDPR